MTKPCVLLLPGLLCDRALFQHQIETLGRDYDFRVADFSEGDSIEEFAAKALEIAPAQFSLVGLSMGGYVAFEILRQVPERVTRLALLDTTPHDDTPEQTDFRNALIEMANEQSLAPVTEMLIPKQVHPKRLGDENLVKTIDAMAFRIGEKAFVRQQTAIMGRRSSLGDLAKITCSTLIAVGRQDSLTPPVVAREMAREIPHARLVEIENCGHMSTLEQPEALSALLSYWLQDMKGTEN